MITVTVTTATASAGKQKRKLELLYLIRVDDHGVIIPGKMNELKTLFGAISEFEWVL
jgi:hypothetical protein